MTGPLPRSTFLPAVADPVFDGFARLVRELLGVPIALVTLVDADRQVFPGALGLPEPWQTSRCTSLLHSFCRHVVASGQALVVTDARRDDHLADNPAIADLHVIAYAGIPLTDRDGTVLGSLCAIDDRPRHWDHRALDMLTDLARACSSELQLRLERDRAEADRSRLGLAITASGVGTFDWDLSGDGMAWDPPLLAMFGYTAEDFEPTTASFYRRLHPDDADRVTHAIATSIATLDAFDAEYRIVLPDGTTRWIQGRGQVLADDTGQAARFIGAAYDTTDVHEGDARTSRLITAMPSGFLSLDQQWRFTVLNPAAEALLGTNQADVAGRTLWEVFPDTVGNEFETAYRTAVSTGFPQTLHAHYPAPLNAWYDILCWPTPDGLSLFFTDVTERTRAQRDAEAAAARLTLLAAVSDLLTDSLGIDDVLTELPRLLVPDLADGCVLTVIGVDGRARDVSSWHVDPDLRVHVAGYAGTRLVGLAGETPLGQAIHTGRARRLSAEQVAAVQLHPTARAHLDALGPQRATLLPLRAQDRTLGALTLLSAADRPADSRMELIAADIAVRLGTALATDRLIKARTQVAEVLQRSLLSDPPEPDHAHVVVRYLPASQAARVGGDWYDSFIQPGGTTMIVIGDVAGHDTTAAAAMGQLRGLLRGIATYSDAGPAEVLRGLDTSMQLLQANTLATAAVARFEQTPGEVEAGTTRMTWTNAGHPPPLLITNEGTVEVLAPGRPEIPLGVDPSTQRTEHTTVLDRGATILLYTDGLIERRGTDLDVGLQHLITAAADLADAALDDLCDGILRRLAHDRPADDIALVAVRLHRQDRPRPPEAGPTAIPPGLPPPAHPAQ